MKVTLHIRNAEWDEHLDQLIAAAKDAIDNHTGQVFDNVDEEIRFFDSQAGVSVGIDELQAATLVRFDTNLDGSFATTMVEGTDFEFYPLNTVPKNSMHLKIPNGSRAQFPDGQKTVEITATWGYAEVPAIVTQAACQTVERWFKRKDKDYEQITGDGKANVLDPDVMVMLSRYRGEASGALEIIWGGK